MRRAWQRSYGKVVQALLDVGAEIPKTDERPYPSFILAPLLEDISPFDRRTLPPGAPLEADNIFHWKLLAE